MPAKKDSTVKLGYREYCLIPEDGQRHEVMDGEHIVNPAPGTYHQTVSRRMQFQLYSQIELAGLGEVYNAPTDLQLSEHDIVQPDLIVVLRGKSSIITPSRIHGPPDLVIEILSPSTRDLDRDRKKQLYCRSGVSEYWIVDLQARVVEQFFLHDEVYTTIGIHAEQIEPHIVPDVMVNLAEVW